jgi:hypothetical protein
MSTGLFLRDAQHLHDAANLVAADDGVELAPSAPR